MFNDPVTRQPIPVGVMPIVSGVDLVDLLTDAANTGFRKLGLAAPDAIEEWAGRYLDAAVHGDRRHTGSSWLLGGVWLELDHGHVQVCKALDENGLTDQPPSAGPTSEP